MAENSKVVQGGYNKNDEHLRSAILGELTLERG